MVTLQKQEDALQRLESFVHKTEKARRLVHKSQRNALQKARAILGDMSKKEERILEKIGIVLKRHEDVLEKILEVNRHVDETLCNVLLAIRQNEYLQAYYPAQHGQPAQMVVGRYNLAMEKVDVVE